MSQASERLKKYMAIPLQVQLARANFAYFCLGDALLLLPDGMPCNKQTQAAIDQVIEWHKKTADNLCSHKKKLNKVGTITFYQKRNLFNKLLMHVAKPIRYAAGLWTAIGLIWDARITCPAISKSRPWFYLDQAAEKLGYCLVELFHGGDEDGTRIYEAVAWKV